jgi:ABC-type uncharacterized transport system permease subunit
MKNPLNVQLSSRETDRKIAWPASVAFMIVAWLFMAAGLAWFLVEGFRSDAGEWSVWAYVLVGIFLVVVVLVPIQLVRYFREKRASK